MPYNIQEIRNTANASDILSAAATLTESINETYPQHTAWYWDKFVPGIDEGKRVLVAAIEEESGVLAGVALLKNTPEEKKICTLFIDPSHRNKGLASALIRQSMTALGTDKPEITVSSGNYPQLSKLLGKYGFDLTKVIHGAYKAGEAEYYFNTPGSPSIEFPTK
jgi:ribosomal protein S18 acetylase RimI-like enzyme